MLKNLKQIIFETIEEDISERLSHKVFEAFIIILIILNVLSIVLQSCLPKQYDIFNYFEIISVFIFTIEYILRLWTADLKSINKSTLENRVKFVFSPIGIIDILSILPFYLSLFFPANILDGRILRALRLLRLLRIFKLTRFLDSFQIIQTVFKKRKYELIITGFIALLIIIISSTLMFEIEHDAQPDKFPDILSSFWWAIATLTTIGYGDVFPITGVGKFISAVISITGIGLIALPTGILSTSFIEEFRTANEKQKEEEKSEEKDSICYCPHCGKNLKI